MLNAANTFSGGLTLTAGTLTVGNNSALGAASGPFLINASATFQATVATTIANPFTFGAISAPVTVTIGALTTAPLTFSNNGTILGTVLTLTVNGAGGVYFPASLAGVANLTATGAGTLFLLGNNTYLGGTTISAPTVVVNGPNSVGPGILTLTSGSLVNTTGVTFTNVVNVTGSFSFSSTSLPAPTNLNPNPLTFANSVLFPGRGVDLDVQQQPDVRRVGIPWAPPVPAGHSTLAGAGDGQLHPDEQLHQPRDHQHGGPVLGRRRRGGRNGDRGRQQRGSAAAPPRR